MSKGSIAHKAKARRKSGRRYRRKKEWRLRKFEKLLMKTWPNGFTSLLESLYIPVSLRPESFNIQPTRDE